MAQSPGIARSTQPRASRHCTTREEGAPVHLGYPKRRRPPPTRGQPKHPASPRRDQPTLLPALSPTPHAPTAISQLPADGARLEPPRCVSCGATIRLGVVWFGESLPQHAWGSARKAAEEAQVFIVCGTSSLVQPAASLTGIASAAGATTIQINPNATDADGIVTHSLRGPAGTVLPQLLAEAWPNNT